MVYIPKEIRVDEAGDTRVKSLESGPEDLALNPISATSQLSGLAKVHYVPHLFYHLSSLHVPYVAWISLHVIRKTDISSL